jgi:hypothetical protein
METFDANFANKALEINNIYNLIGSFGGWPRCSLVTDPCGYAPRSRLAGRQNPRVIL